MKDIIIAYPHKEAALRLRSFLENEGYHVSHVCALGSSALGIAGEKDDGVIICASILPDMSAGTMAEQLPPDFDVLSLSRNGTSECTGNLITVSLPLDRDDFLRTVAVLVSSQSSFTRRREEDAEYLADAKLILMHTRDMTELQAHRWLQKESMRTGLCIKDIAKKVIGEFG